MIEILIGLLVIFILLCLCWITGLIINVLRESPKDNKIVNGAGFWILVILFFMIAYAIGDTILRLK